MRFARIIMLGAVSMGLGVTGVSASPTQTAVAMNVLKKRLGSGVLASADIRTPSAGNSLRALLLLQATSKNPQLRKLVGADQVPHGMPQESTRVRMSVPLYPGARPESWHVRTYPAPVSASWYLLASPVRAYYVHASRLSVENWYQNAFTERGYLLTGSSGGGTGQTTYDFSKVPLLATPEIVGVRLRAKNGGTDVIYGSTLTEVPPRPLSSRLATTALALTLRYRKPDRGQSVTLRVTKRPLVHRLIQLLNAMPLNRGGDYMDCPVRGTSPLLEVYVAQPPGTYPKASLVQGDPCDPGTIGTVQVQSNEAFWTFIQGLMAHA